MKKLFVVLFIFLTAGVFAQQKYALVIGNGAYTNYGSLRNAENDANDVAAALQGLGFTVDKVINGNLNQMENAAVRLKNRLSEAGNNSYGFFYYAGHGIEADGVNYLIPADVSIPDKDFLKARAFPVQIMLEMLNSSRNALNIVVLDACREFPATWSRSLSRGLTVVTNPPANHIIMYATGAGKLASDGGTGRNGLFTGHLLNNLKTSGLDVNEVFRRTMSDVARTSNNEQRPALYTDFAETAFLGAKPSGGRTEPNPNPTPVAQPIPDGLEYEVVNGKSVTIKKYTGNAANLNIPAQIQGLPVTAIGYRAFDGCGSLTSVTIPSSVTSIGDGAFIFCSSLTSVTIPSSVTSIDGNAFSYCHSLTNITVDNRNTSYASIDGVLFDKNIRTIISYPAGKTAKTYTIPSSVTSIGFLAFSVCRSLTSVTIPSSVTSIGGYAFGFCSSLTSITIPSSVTAIGYYAFYECNSLTSVTLSRRTQVGERAFPETARIVYRD